DQKANWSFGRIEGESERSCCSHWLDVAETKSHLPYAPARRTHFLSLRRYDADRVMVDAILLHAATQRVQNSGRADGTAKRHGRLGTRRSGVVGILVCMPADQGQR